MAKSQHEKNEECSSVDIQVSIFRAKQEAAQKARDKDRRRLFGNLIEALDRGWTINTEYAKQMLREWE